MPLSVAVILGDDDRGLDAFGDAVEKIALGSILHAPAGAGLVLCSFEVGRDPRIYLDLVCHLAAYNRYARWLAGDDVASIYGGLLRYEERNLIVCSGSVCAERETFQSNVALFQKGSGDCADLVAARCAEPDVLRAGGEPKLELIEERADGSRAYHAVIHYPDGSTEDPSALLGMPA